MYPNRQKIRWPNSSLEADYELTFIATAMAPQDTWCWLQFKLRFERKINRRLKGEWVLDDCTERQVELGIISDGENLTRLWHQITAQ